MSTFRRPVRAGLIRRVADFVVVGGGCIGLAVAAELARRYPSAKVALLEKEKSMFTHASGRNSGVLHGGFFYPQGSLKANFCRPGNVQLTEFIKSRGLKLNSCGKLVVARSDRDLETMELLLEQARIYNVVN